MIEKGRRKKPGPSLPLEPQPYKNPEVTHAEGTTSNTSPRNSIEATVNLSGCPCVAAGQPEKSPADSAGSLSASAKVANANRDGQPVVSATPEMADSSDAEHPSPPQSISRTIAVEQASSAGGAQPVKLDIQTQTVECTPSGEVNDSSQRQLRGETPSGWETKFKMVIHVHGTSKTRIAQLDTGADVDVMSKPVADALGMNLETYSGEDVLPLGGRMTPLGQLTLDWHVMGKELTYTTTFLVLNTKEFDVLLSHKTIGEIGFWTRNHKVWYLKTG